MATLFDELLATTKVDLTGFAAGLREAEVQAERTRAKLRETLTIPVSSGGSTSGSIKAFNDQLKESEAIQARISKQFTGTAFSSGSSILQHQRAVNTEMKEAEAIQSRLSRQFAGSSLPAATMSLAQHQRAVNAELKEAEAIQARINKQYATTPLPVASSSLAQHRQQLEEAAKASERYAQSWITSGQRLQGLGASLTMGVTAPLALIGTTAVRAAMGFDQIIAKMTTLAGVSPQMANSWRDTILNMSVATGRKPDDMAEAAYRIASSGLADKSQTPAILETVAKGSAIGMGSVTDLGETVTSAINAYKSFNLDAAQSTGILIKAIQEGKGEAKDFAPIMGALGIMAEHAGISFAQMAASVAALTKLGAPAAEAGTMVGRLVDEFMAPKPHSVKMFDDLKIPIEQIQKMLRGPQGLLDALELIGSKTGGAARLERELFPRMEGFRANIGLSGPNLAEARRTFGEVATGGPQTVAQEFSFIAQQPFFKTEQAGAEFNSSMIRLGHEILPLVSSELKFMAGTLETVTKLFTGMPAPLTSVATVLLEVAAAAGPIAFLTGSIEKLYGQLLRFAPWMIGLLTNPVTIGIAVAAAGAYVAKGIIDETIDKVAGPEQKPFDVSNFRVGSSFHLKSGVGFPEAAERPPSPLAHIPHIQTAAEKAAAERLARERENTQVDADKAEFAFQKKIAGITGDTDLFAKAGQGELDSEEARAVRRAKEDGQSITDIHRRFAQQRIELGLEETNAFLFAEQKKEQAADKSASFKLRSIQVQEKAETGLLDVQLGSTRRQIQIDEQRGAPLSRILTLYQQEADLITKKATAEQSAAARSIPILQTELDANRAIVESMTKRRDALQGQNLTGNAALARDAEVYKINEDLTVEQGRQLEIKEKLNAADTEGARIQEQTLSDLQRIEQEQRRINPTFQQAVQDRVGQSEYGANKEYADIAIDGIHSIGHELTAMLAKGKLDWVSLGNVAQDVLRRIEDKMLDRSIDSMLNAVMGGGNQQQSKSGSFNLSSLLSLFGGSSGAGSIPGLSLAPNVGFDASKVLWNAASSGGSSGTGGLGGLLSMFGGASGGSAGGGGGIMSMFSGLFGGAGGAAGAGGGLMGMLSGAGGGIMSMLGGAGGGIMSLLGGAGGGISSILSMLPMLFLHEGGTVGSGGIPRYHMGALEIGGAAFGGLTLLNLLQGSGSGGNGGMGMSGILGMLFGNMGMSSGGSGLTNSIFGSGIMGLIPGLFHSGGLAGDESLAVLQHGEMVLSRGETANLFAGGGARVPGGYRPDARIFMTNVGSGSRGNSGGVTSSSHGPITVHIHASDVNSYRGSEQHIAADLARKIARANRRNN